MYDRLSGLIPRLALASRREGGQHLMRDALSGLRVGLNLIHLREDSQRLPGSGTEAVADALTAIRGHFAHTGAVPAESLRGTLDNAIDRVSRIETPPASTQVLLALFGIRQALFGHRDFFDMAPG